MAVRPLYLPADGVDGNWVTARNVEFLWIPGMARIQKQRCIKSLHEAACELEDVAHVLEISSKSSQEGGVDLSAFNLKLSMEGESRSVEVLFQGSKVFADGSSCQHLYDKSSLEACKENRARDQKIVGFKLFAQEWPVYPERLFYCWLYLNAVYENPLLSEFIIDADGFTDIEFNPKKSLNSQAYAAALYKALWHGEKLEFALECKENFIAVLNPNGSIKHTSAEQLNLF